MKSNVTELQELNVFYGISEGTCYEKNAEKMPFEPKNMISFQVKHCMQYLQASQYGSPQPFTAESPEVLCPLKEKKRKNPQTSGWDC